jgi:hypothetical protein
VGLLGAIANPPKSEDKYVEKVFNWSEVHLSEMTCHKIHTLVNSSINSTDSHPRWKYQKLGILDENSTCQCITNDYEYIALKNDTLCPMPRQNHCFGTLYDVFTVCVLEKISDYKKEALEDLFFSRRHDPRSRYLQRAVCKQRGWEC